MESTISKNPRYRGEHTQLPFQISMAAYIETQSLSKTVFKPTVWKRYINDISLWDKSKPDIVDFFKFTERVNLHITHWDNLLRHGCIPRHNIQRKMRKSYHWRKDVYTFSPLTTHRMLKWIWPTRSLEYPTNKLLWGSISDFKKRLMDRGWPHNFERKIAIRSKTHRRKAALLKQNNKEEKEILPFMTQCKPFSVYYKRSFNKKV